ncbi:hypothetical protein LTR84_001934 [Exophiala bonariae]|uniref:ADA HAT complex component 1 n=1 Tax=Exophiala bonariae TaxID=1690606 RepID=A0AAV9NC55_9EURO|nr:hypothetical protein LTR84_001934 [Exophiala bonariae]
MSPLPPPTSINSSGFATALELYPSLVENVYKSKLKDVKKLNEALERDKWRFEELPLSIPILNGGKESKAGKSQKRVSLSKAIVERLVQWKITHGHSRPFLPAMIRKNDAAAVEEQTALAYEKLGGSPSTSAPSTATLIAALDSACKLTGIGPATGTLILAVYDPKYIPFFQDEMFLWFFPDHKDAKLKYTQKEYLQLYDAVAPVLKKLGVKAVDLEKVAYVLGHKELLEPTDLSKLEEALGGNSDNATKKPAVKKAESSPKSDAAPSKPAKGTKRGAETSQHSEESTSKRQTRRNRS